jgi:ABC-2 type transport system permease protein
LSELTGIYALWYREIKVFTRERSRIVSSVATPLLWLIAFGSGLGPAISEGLGTGSGVSGYQYIFPGILMLTVLFTSIFFGLYLVWDKRVDFFKEVLAAPLRRTTLFVGKMLGGCTDALIQAGLLLVLGVLFGVTYTPYSLLALIVYVFFIAVGITSLGLAIGAQMTSFEGFGLVQSFVVLPLFFFSGAIFPLKNLPAVLQTVTLANPLTYMVDGMRGALLPGTSQFSPLTDFGLGITFTLVLLAVGVISFRHMST